ncbi:DUF1460 domain-containing protein [Acerihabitans sp. TG2]|uniref:DUF1460 domain-containing protein n=1 Tax=Acerihabitans sp. TG2 TaxID=3096008 RepID=UPI002B23B99F|nr:DUF1460 domain-containing protein [Acerihabitans sp. TG2]MEA9389194.1 DUF1460 domain-containing protein [Acerihabitans sp. TG2]
MRKYIPALLAVSLIGCVGGHQPMAQAGLPAVDIDNGTLAKIDQIIVGQRAQASQRDLGERITAISANFLGTPYVANRLVGSHRVAERLVIDFRGVDCFTYLDYVDALSKSTSPEQFNDRLRQTRYINGDVSYAHRKQFFTDWSSLLPLNAMDITRAVSPSAITILKTLNQTANGGKIFPSLGVETRAVSYIPAKAVSSAVIGRLKSGDFIGIYTPTAGMDVTHTGIFIMTDRGPVLRNASSRAGYRKVVDSPFLAYIRKTPGIVVLRAI